MRRFTLWILIVVAALAISCTMLGYLLGKHAADRYYANSVQFCGSTSGQAVKLIPPISYKVSQSQAQNENVRPNAGPFILYNLEHNGLCKWGYTDAKSVGHMYDAPCEPKVKLIQPLRYGGGSIRIPATPGQISIEEPK